MLGAMAKWRSSAVRGHFEGVVRTLSGKRDARRDEIVGARLKPGHTRNMALGCSTTTPTGTPGPARAQDGDDEEHNDVAGKQPAAQFLTNRG